MTQPVDPTLAARQDIEGEALPAWEVNYEPGNVSDYLIGYANSESAAKGAALAWVMSQSDKDPASLEWIDVPPSNEYDHCFSLIQNAEDGMALDIGITVRHRVAATAWGTARTHTGAHRHTPRPTVGQTADQAACIKEAIREFPFCDFGMDDVDPNDQYAEWFEALATAIVGRLATMENER